MSLSSEVSPPSLFLPLVELQVYVTCHLYDGYSRNSIMSSRRLVPGAGLLRPIDGATASFPTVQGQRLSTKHSTSTSKTNLYQANSV